MIQELILQKDYLALAKTDWKNIPKLAVIAGLNGSGKTMFLNALNQYFGGQHHDKPFGNHSIFTPSAQDLRGKVKYVQVGFAPGDIRPKDNKGALFSLEQSKSSLLSYIRNANFENSPENMNNLVDSIFKKLNFNYDDLSNIDKNAIDELSDHDIVSNFPNDISLKMKDYFDNSYITEVFYDYENRFTRYRSDNYGKKENLSDEEIYARLGSRPPWIVINESFEKYGFNYRIAAPNWSVAYEPAFIDCISNAKVQFGQLSTGEKILVTFVLWSYNASQKSHAKLFLFDEIDAHLNPSLSKMMMEIISEKIVGDFDIQVIMTTHNP